MLFEIDPNSPTDIFCDIIETLARLGSPYKPTTVLQRLKFDHPAYERMECYIIYNFEGIHIARARRRMRLHIDTWRQELSRDVTECCF